MYRSTAALGLFAALTATVGLAGAQTIYDQSGLATETKKSNSLRNDLFNGRILFDKTSKDHAEAVRHQAILAVHPVYTVATSAVEGGTFRRKSLNDAVDAFSQAAVDRLAKNRAKTGPVQPAFFKEVTVAVGDICRAKNGRKLPLTVVNGAMMLEMTTSRRVGNNNLPISDKEYAAEVGARLEEGTGEFMAKECLKLMEENPANEGASYYFYRTLANLLALPSEKPYVSTETRDKVVEAAMKQIDRKPVFTKITPRSEVEGYKVLRLQAVRALQAAKVSTTAAKLRPALALARVAAADASVFPEPRVEERAEAAIGLCKLGPKAGADADLDYDVAAYCVARAVAEFGRAANANIDAKGFSRRGPWKVEASRLLEALDGLRESKKPFAVAVAAECAKVLVPLEEGRSGPANELLDWISNNAKEGRLFRSEERSLIGGPAAAPKD